MKHLFNTDDNLVFFQANIVEWGRLNQILNLFEEALEYMLNREKTSFFFSRNTKPSTKAYMIKIAKLNDSSNLEKYLGLPSLVAKPRLMAFQILWKK